VDGAEVDEHGMAVRMAHEDVVAFDVPVDRMDGMSSRERLRQLRKEEENLLSGGSVLTSPLVQRSAVDPLRDEVRVLHSGRWAPDATAQQAGNAGVMDLGEDMSLARKARIPRVEGELEGNGAILLVAGAHGAVDTAVRALAVMLQHSPTVYLSAWEKQRGEFAWSVHEGHGGADVSNITILRPAGVGRSLPDRT
jgi:hypothetical protein